MGALPFHLPPMLSVSCLKIMPRAQGKSIIHLTGKGCPKPLGTGSIDMFHTTKEAFRWWSITEMPKYTLLLDKTLSVHNYSPACQGAQLALIHVYTHFCSSICYISGKDRYFYATRRSAQSTFTFFPSSFSVVLLFADHCFLSSSSDKIHSPPTHSVLCTQYSALGTSCGLY